jgi:hypothetical protein
VAVQYFTSLQAFAHQLLTHAIREALDSGRSVPCQSNPAKWDDSSNDPAICHGCPVLRLCSAYADTGAVEHGVIAGRRIHSRPRAGVVALPQEAA